MSFSNRRLVAMAVSIAASATCVHAQTTDGIAPDVPPAVVEASKVHEGSIVKTEIQTSIEQNQSPTAPVPGNQDNGIPQPTFNAVNTINSTVSNSVTSASLATGSDVAEPDTYSLTKNVLTYPLNDPINGQYSGQPTSPLILRESSTSAQTIPNVNQSRYQELPLSLEGAKSRLNQLKLMAAGSTPQDALEHVNQFIRWLSDVIDAHNKMAAAFSKNDTTRGAATAEKQLTTSFSYLRFQSQLLKADLLIEEHRNPEALAPLVEIVLAMPTNVLGKSAYQRLQNLGFSPAELESRTSSAEGNATDSELKVATESESPESKVSEPPKRVAMTLPGRHSVKRPHATQAVQPPKAAKVTGKRSPRSQLQ